MGPRAVIDLFFAANFVERLRNLGVSRKNHTAKACFVTLEKKCPSRAKACPLMGGRLGAGPAPADFATTVGRGKL